MTQSFETRQIHAGATADPTTHSRATPIYQTTSYVFDDTEHAADLFALRETGNIYTRIGNPTQDVLEQRIASLEGGIGALAVASGSAAATYSFLNIAGTGDHIVSSATIYGGTYNLLLHTFAKLGIEVTFVKDQDDLSEWQAAVRPNTKLLFAETIGNPLVNVLDIEGVAGVAHAAGVPLIVDNTVASPYLLRPFEHGADIVIHSATKFLGGHGTTIAGLIVDGGKFPWSKYPDKFIDLNSPDPSYNGLNYTEALGDGPAFITKARVQLLRDTGAAISPQSAWNILQGIETLSLRLERHSSNALALAQWLEGQDQVTSVSYAGLESSKWKAAADKYLPNGASGLLSFEIKGGREAGEAFVNGVSLFSLLVNIGDVRSLITHPASTTHSQLSDPELAAAGVTPGLIRLSVGIEALEDLKADLELGFKAAAAAQQSASVVK